MSFPSSTFLLSEDSFVSCLKWNWTNIHFRFFKELTDEAKDVSDGGDEDDQHVVEGQNGSSDHHMANPAELSTAEQ